MAILKFFFGDQKLSWNLSKFFLAIFIVLIPFHTRWIIFDFSLGQDIWEYGRVSLYLNVLVLFLATLFFALSRRGQDFYFSKNWYLYFIFAYSLIISFFSLQPLLSFYYLLFIYLALLFAYLVKFFSKWFVFKAFLFSGLIQSFLAVSQIFSQKVAANKWLGLAEHLPAVLGTSVVEIDGLRLLRAYGSLPHPNILGGFLFVVIFVGLYLWINFYRQELAKDKKEKISKKKIVELIFIITSLALSSFALLASFSRSALLALLLSLFSVLLINIFRRSWLAASMIAKYLVLFTLVFVSFNIWWPDSWFSRFDFSSRLEQKSIDERVSSLDQLGWDNFRHGFFGQGLGMNTLATYYKYPEKNIYDIQPIHDIFILLLAEVGVVGAFLLFNVVRMIIKSANQVDLMSTSLILGLGIIGLFDHYLWTSWTGWLLMAFALVNLYRPKESP
ncbi:MAG: O-antigen ligase family protein [Patescibacteria group bacterium]|nr:O-antigen ligase family protein [Patescibacteria group bacterium]